MNALTIGVRNESLVDQAGKRQYQPVSNVQALCHALRGKQESQIIRFRLGNNRRGKCDN
jgi:hypothetical protein